jgi:hypothetical protein
MDIGEVRRVVKVVPEPAPMTPIAPVEPAPEKVPA